MRSIVWIWLLGCSYSPKRIESQVVDAPVAGDATALVDVSPTGTPTERCTLKYGAVPQFELCSATETGCVFYVDVGVMGDTLCDAICGPLGGTCFDNYDGDCTNMNGSQMCQVANTNQVCTCSL